MRETQREWNYRLQKWEIEEGESQEGTADSSGLFVARMNLSAVHRDLEEKQRRFEDESFTAYVRDPSSGRTEQRRFDIRITTEPIHLYLIESGDHSSAYASAFYADGRVAACRIRVNGSTTLTTNSYGLVRLPVADDTDSVDLVAEDSRGLRGHLQERIRGRSDGPRIRIATDKTLYRPGEPIRVAVHSSEPAPGVALEVLKDDTLLDSQWLDLRSGSANVELPWRESFIHEITIGAAFSDRYNEFASRTLLFPANQDLNLSIRTGQSTYRPSEEATATFTALTPAGNPVLAELGVAVVDTAVDERARTESGSRRFYQSFGWMWFRAGMGELAGMTRQDLYRLDTSKPFASELDLVAEAMLAHDPYWPRIERSANYREDLPGQFKGVFTGQFSAAIAWLKSKYEKDYHHPRDLRTLKEDLREAGFDFDQLRDPWEQPYRAVFETVGRFDRIAILSAGPDKRFGTEDDLTAVTVDRDSFKPYHDRIEAALKSLPSFPGTDASARTALEAAGIRIEDLKDPWGTGYALQFQIVRDRGVMLFRSAGPDRRFSTSDDFEADEVSGNYFAAMQAKLSGIISARARFPADERVWNRLLRSAGLFPLRDLWGTPIYPVFQQQSRYTDLQRFYTAAKYGDKPQQRTEVVPATESYQALYLRSAGPDRIAGTSDDFDLSTFFRTARVETAQKPRARVRSSRRAPTANTGSIAGRVLDLTGTAMPGATIRAVRTGADAAANLEYQAQSGASGLYLLGGLLPGFYDVRIEARGFQPFLTTGVPVSRSKSTVVDAVLNVGAVTETIMVAASPTLIDTMEASVSSGSPAEPQTTPRVREYFPETLLWAPSLETDVDGRTRIKFRLADNITTWKLQAIASAETGKTGTAAMDIRAFQPFFIDHAPPQVLTQGDQIQLPATIRNYLDRDQTVNVSLRPEKWFEVTGSNQRDVRVGAGNSVNTIFPIRATTTVVDGKQRISAKGLGVADAIEKPVTVHPDGREISVTKNAVFADSSIFEIPIPDRAITGSTRAKLKIYPNLLSHVIDGIDGILQRPNGCAEQVISSAYPSLMLLRYFRRLELQDHPLRKKARRHLQSGLDRLVGYRSEDGSFSYWGRGDGDVNVTAYALTFLTQAKEFAVVDDDLIKEAREWLLKRQAKNGEWLAYSWTKEVDARRTAYQTVEAAIALSATDASEQAGRALRYLSAAASRTDEPYLIASIALLAQAAGQTRTMENMLANLRRLVRRENGLAYWNIETTTPFYGWGLAGRLETTALAIRALVRGGQPSDKPLIDSGVLFLLRSKDRHGVWHSTQATVKVLEAILMASGDPSAAGDAGPAEILAGGRVVTSVSMPKATELTGPVRVDLSPFLSRGANQISIRRSQRGDPAQVQLAASYYVPWSDDPGSPQTTALRFRVAFDRTAVRPRDEIICRVDAERVGFQGYGMMVAEIGLPPGADVDRHSLDDAMIASGYVFSHYDVLPDKVLVYLWPRAGGISFQFRFQSRMAMEAKNAESALYDYYNPDAKLVVRPVRFRVEPGNSASAGR